MSAFYFASRNKRKFDYSFDFDPLERRLQRSKLSSAELLAKKSGRFAKVPYLLRLNQLNGENYDSHKTNKYHF
jgi:hypothetical protein